MLLVHGRLRAIGAFDIKEMRISTPVPIAGPGSGNMRGRISCEQQNNVGIVRRSCSL